MSKKYVKAFTTLELLIILVIIGFFVAMLAPRLSQMFDDATFKVSDMNKKDSMRFSRMWTVRHGPQQIGNNLINLVNYTGDTAANAATAANYEFPSLAEFRTPEDGPEWLSYQFVNRLKPYLHTLTADEVDELDAMGLTHIYMLDTKPDATTQPTSLKRFRIEAGMRVLMVGAGINANGVDYACSCATSWDEASYVVGGVAGSTTGAIGQGGGNVEADAAGRNTYDTGGIPHSASVDAADGIGYEDGIGYPEYMYRILLGIGEDSTLVKDGVVDNEGISPDALSQGKHYRFNRYVVVLPRLRSTVQYVTGRVTGVGNQTNCPKLFVGERTDDNNVTERNQWIVADYVDNTAQPFDNFDVISPEGYKVLDRTLEKLKTKADYDGSSLWTTITDGGGVEGTIYDPQADRMFLR